MVYRSVSELERLKILRDIAILRLSDLSLAEIAEELNMTKGQVKAKVCVSNLSAPYWRDEARKIIAETNPRPNKSDMGI